MHSFDHTFTFPADLSALGPALRTVADACRTLNVPVLTILQIELLLEELFTNSVGHGYDDAPDARIWISLTLVEDSLHITYADAAPPYNPLVACHNRVESLSLPALDHCPVGGIGLILIQNTPFPLHYRFRDGRNQITCTLPLPELVRA